MKKRITITFFTLAFVIFFLSYGYKNYFNNELKGRAIIVSGISSSGKSSLIKHIIKLDDSFIIIDQDVIWRKLVSDYLLISQPLEYKKVYGVLQEALLFPILYSSQRELLFSEEEKLFVNNIFKKGNNTKTNINFLESLKKNYMNNWQLFVNKSKDEVINKAIYYMNNGKSVIIDGVLNDAEIAKLGKNRVITILLYCPLVEIVKRIAKRNKEALISNNFMEWRTPWRSLIQYTELFQVENKELNSGNVILESISKESLTLQIKLALNMMPSNFINYLSFKNYLFNNLKFQNKIDANIVPNINADIIINTYTISSEQSAYIAYSLIFTQIKLHHDNNKLKDISYHPKFYIRG